MPLRYLLFLFIFCCCVTKGIFAVDGMVVVSSDPAFHDKWNYTLASHTPQISKSQSVFVDQKFSVLLFISKYNMGPKNHVHVNYDLKIIDPDGSIIFDKEGIEGVNSFVSQPDQVILSESSLKVSLDSTEKLGDYEVHIRLHDVYSDSVFTLTDTITLEKYAYLPFFEKDEDVVAWKQHYYRNPTPELAVDGFLYFARSEDLSDPNSYWPEFMFFREIFRTHPFLMGTLAKLYPSQTPGVRTQILCLMRFVGYRNTDFYTSLPLSEKKALDQIRKQNLPDPFGQTVSPLQLEMLWQVFLASGRYLAIHKFVAALEKGDHRHLAGYRSQDSSSPTKAESIEASLDQGIYQIATLILVTQTEAHPLVKEYCEFMYERTELTGLVKAELKDILRDR